MDWFKIEKGVYQDSILLPCLFIFYAEYFKWNAGLDELQAGIKTVVRNFNNFRYPDDTTLITESNEEIKSLLMKVKEESEKDGLKLNIQKTEIMASSLKEWRVLFSSAPKSLQMAITVMKLKDAWSLEEKLWQT